jgi:hypothetical protein
MVAFELEERAELDLGVLQQLVEQELPAFA